MYLTENSWVYNSKAYSRFYQCLNRNRILSSEETETTFKTELRFNCHVKASVFICSCFILWIRSSSVVTWEYTISQDKCVPKGFLTCVDMSYILLFCCASIGKQTNKKKGYMWIGMCSIAVSLSVLRLQRLTNAALSDLILVTSLNRRAFFRNLFDFNEPVVG